MRVVSVVLMAAMITPAFASDIEDMQRARQLAEIISSEQLCGLVYDQSAIERWVEANVRPDDKQFAVTLDGFIWSRSAGLEKMTASQRTAHCLQIRRTARSLSFIASNASK